MVNFYFSGVGVCQSVQRHMCVSYNVKCHLQCIKNIPLQDKYVLSLLNFQTERM